MSTEEAFNLIKELEPNLRKEQSKKLVSFIENNKGEITPKDLELASTKIRDELKNDFATKEDLTKGLKRFVTKEDLKNIEDKVLVDLNKILADLNEILADLNEVRLELRKGLRNHIKWIFGFMVPPIIIIIAILTWL